MAIEPRISNDAYERMALHEPDRKWELWDGQLREKAGLTYAHNEVAHELGFLLRSQLDRAAYRVRIDAGRSIVPARRSSFPMSLSSRQS